MRPIEKRQHGISPHCRILFRKAPIRYNARSSLRFRGNPAVGPEAPRALKTAYASCGRVTSPNRLGMAHRAAAPTSV